MTQRQAPILIVGGDGQLGRALRALDWPAPVRLVAPARSALDLTRQEDIARAFAQDRFAAVVNAAAYTAVDRAEDEPAAAFAANAMGPARLAEAARAAGALMVHVSTDYVFSGPGPHAEDAEARPLNVYGASKRAGELAVLSISPQASVVRTAWLMSPQGVDQGANFLTALLSRRDRPSLDMVADQQGSPTLAGDLAQAIRDLTLLRLSDPDRGAGVLHLTNAGEASRLALAEAIFAAVRAAGHPAPDLRPVAVADYPTRARRPADSRLAMARAPHELGLTLRPWREAITEAVAAALSETAP